MFNYEVYKWSVLCMIQCTNGVVKSTKFRLATMISIITLLQLEIVSVDVFI